MHTSFPMPDLKSQVKQAWGVRKGRIGHFFKGGIGGREGWWVG